MPAIKHFGSVTVGFDVDTYFVVLNNLAEKRRFRQVLLVKRIEKSHLVQLHSEAEALRLGEQISQAMEARKTRKK